MRRLAPVDAVLVRELLGGGTASQADRIRATGIPRRTFQAALRRIRLRGWVVTRLVPDPVRCGWPSVTFSLAQPYLEALSDLVLGWKSAPGTVALWSFAESVFSVRFDAGGSADPRSSAPGLRNACSVTVDLRERRVPIFFDFEGAWDRLTGSGRSVGYPRGLGGEPGSAQDDPAIAPSAMRSALGDLLSGAREAEASEPGPSVFGMALRRRRIARAVRRGWLRPRRFLDASAVNESVEPVAEGLGFVHARLRPGRTETGLLADLTTRARVAPFLFASDGRTVLAGLLSAPRPAARPPERTARVTPLEVLRETCESIVVQREPVRSMVRPVDYRFEALLEEPPADPGRAWAPGSAAVDRVSR